MSVFEEIEYNSDEEINKKQHARLLDEVLQLDQRQYVKKPTRTEPATHVSEFNLVKSSYKGLIDVNNLTKSLGKKPKYTAISNKVKSTRKVRTLRKPLEKPQAERIRRTVGFTKTKLDLNKWNSIVEQNRLAVQIKFPLSQDEIEIVDPNKKKPVDKCYKSELEIELEKLEPKTEVFEVEDKFPLSMAEIMAKRKEMAKLRAIQSFQAAKAHKKNKIKSKKYHRIQRKEKLKEQIKEFELLQKTNPEEALRKLEHLEKTRAEERMSLRHRSTGKWAKNKQIRAKYDKESRQALAQQLTLSRELTQKLKANDSSESETEEQLPRKQTNESNPWISDKPSEVEEFVSGYKKFWNEQNNIKEDKTENSKNEFISLNTSSNPENENIKPVKLKKQNKNIDINEQTNKSNKKDSAKTDNKKFKIKKIGSKKVKIETHCNFSWTVTSIEDEINNFKSENKVSIEDMFETLEDTIRSKAKQKITELQNATKPNKKRKLEHKTYTETEIKSDIIFPCERQMRPEVDEELREENDSETEEVIESQIENLQNLANNLAVDEQNISTKDNSNIDPNKYIKPINKSIQITELDTEIPDISHQDDNVESDEENQQKAFISEAFADDDVVNDFIQEKQDIIENEKPKDINLFLPGWGSWGGKNIIPSKRKQKRFIIKMPEEMPRRDDNKGNLIINECKDTKVKKHQVSEIPFPFTSVKDFEASIRAPIGDTFIPQTAFRRLIKPSVVTEKGKIIEPMNESILLKENFT